MGELGKPWPRVDLRLRDQAFEQRTDGLRAQEHRLHHPARAKQTLGKHMAAVGIGAELDLIDGNELRAPVQRHGLDGAGEPARLRRQNLLLPGDQRHMPGALAGHHLVVVLAGQQAQRKPDDAGRMGQQTFHGQMGLASVRRAKDSLHAGREIRHAQMVEVAGAFCKPSTIRNSWFIDGILKCNVLRCILCRYKYEVDSKEGHTLGHDNLVVWINRQIG